MKYLLISLLIIAIFFQGGITNIPLTLGALILLWIVYQAGWVIIVAFFTGVFIDIVTFHPFGSSSVFFIVTLFLILLYQRKFEIQSVPFIGASVFVFSLLYSAFFIHKSSLLGALATAGIITSVYLLIASLATGKRSSRIQIS